MNAILSTAYDTVLASSTAGAATGLPPPEDRLAQGGTEWRPAASEPIKDQSLP